MRYYCLQIIFSILIFFLNGTSCYGIYNLPHWKRGEDLSFLQAVTEFLFHLGVVLQPKPSKAMLLNLFATADFFFYYSDASQNAFSHNNTR